MAAALRLDLPVTVTGATPTTPAAELQQWWQGVQSDFSALLTEAAHPAASHRLAG